jgi:hypothetical protein
VFGGCQSSLFDAFPLLPVNRLIQIDEKRTMKATEHDKYENIAGSV